MLELLHIENIAVIEEADIRFQPGFNALTGETGAGKSIVIDAMGAVLGGRTSRDLIRTGAAKAFVSAEFSAVPPDLPGLRENGLAPDEDGNLLLQREISGDGKNACRINGRPVTVAQLRQAGEELLNIHGQRDGAQLLDEERHGAYLDRFGRTEGPLAAYRAAYGAWWDLREQIRALQMDEAEKARRIDNLTFQIGELERAGLKPGEEEELTQRRELLRNAGRLIEAVERAHLALSGDEEREGAVSLTAEAEDAMHTAGRMSAQAAELAGRLAELRISADDLEEAKAAFKEYQITMKVDSKGGVDMTCTVETAAQAGVPAMKLTMDAKQAGGNATLNMSLHVANLCEGKLTLTQTWGTTTQTPEDQPPEGSTVVDAGALLDP